jgi:hypothetical protein
MRAHADARWPDARRHQHTYCELFPSNEYVTGLRSADACASRADVQLYVYHGSIVYPRTVFRVEIFLAWASVEACLQPGARAVVVTGFKTPLLSITCNFWGVTHPFYSVIPLTKRSYAGRANTGYSWVQSRYSIHVQGQGQH